jgi:hypothetical protein
MKKERRWMKSALATSVEVLAIAPWARGQRRRPEALRIAVPATSLRPSPLARALAAR